jgi:hypothetical protein
MKTLLSLFVVVAMVAPLSADVVLLQETFEGAAPGTPLNTLGWTSTSSTAVISASVIDQGQSVDWPSGSDWPVLTKGFTHTPVAGEEYTLSATLYAPGTTGHYSDLRILSSAPNVVPELGIIAGYSTLSFGIPNVLNVVTVTPQPLTPVDVKMVVKDNWIDCYYKANGAADWISAGGGNPGASYLVSAFTGVSIIGHAGMGGGMDSVLLTTNVPEPTTLSLLATGVLGLLAYAWRKRR